MFVACEAGKKDVAEFLCNLKIDINKCDSQGFSALMLGKCCSLIFLSLSISFFYTASQNDHLGCVMLLREKNCNFKLKNKEGLNAFQIAIKYNKQACANYLKEFCNHD